MTNEKNGVIVLDAESRRHYAATKQNRPVERAVA